MKSFEQVQRLVIDCIAAGMTTEVAIRSHVNAMGVSPTEVLDALEELERKAWIVSESGPLCARWQVRPIGKAGAKKLPPFHAEIQVTDHRVEHLENCLAIGTAKGAPHD